MPAAPEFRRVLGAEVISNFGSMLSRLAIPWLATLALGATPAQMALLLVADVAAGTAGSLGLGTLVDRHGKRAAMIAADLLRAALLTVLAVLAAREWLTFSMLVVAAACTGLLTVAFELARSAWIAQRVDAPDLARRNSQLSMGGSLSETAAFALGGWLYQWLGAALALVVDALSYAASALCLRGVREAPAAPPAAAHTPSWRGLLADVRAGIAALAVRPPLRALAAIQVLVALGSSIAGTSYMIYVARDLGVETGTLGLIFATGGLGSVAGAWLAPRAGDRFGRGQAIAAGLALLTLGAACIPLAPGSGVLGVALLIGHQVIGDGGHALSDVHDRTLRQVAVPPPLLARVDAGIRSLGYAATLVGAAGGGWFATTAGTRSALWLSTLAYGLAAVVAYLAVVGGAGRSVPAAKKPPSEHHR